MKVGIFGTWRPQPGDNIYNQAQRLGQIATLNGCQVLTGGYSGIMEAACRGAVDVGGIPIGVTCPEIDSVLSPNPWVREEIKARNITERIAIALEMSTITIFFPGRTGTASELALATELRSKGVLKFPIILIGNFWEPFFNWLKSSNRNLCYGEDEENNEIYSIVDNIEDTLHILEVMNK